MTLKTRKPTGRVPWPLILIEGAEKAGKSWACAELSASPRVGQTYWIDLGEGAGDEYGAIPGARYEIVEHDGTFAQILAAVEEIKALAAKATEAGEPPVVLVIDSMTAEWDLLKRVVDQRARARLAKRGRAVAADEEPQISMDLWNDVNSRHRRLMTHLMTFPGIACITARGKEVAAMDDSGRPIERSKEYKVDGQKYLGSDASVWIRVSRDHPPLVIGARSVLAGIRPGVDKPKTLPDLTLERVVFEILGCDPATATVRDLTDPRLTPADLVTPDTDPAGPAQAVSPARARMFDLVKAAELPNPLAFINEVIAPATVERSSELSDGEVGQVIERLERYLAQAEPVDADPWKGNDTHAHGILDRAGGAPAPNPAAEPAPPAREEAPVGSARPSQHRRMHALWNLLGYGDDRAKRLATTSKILGHPVETSANLTEDDAEAVLAWLDSQPAPPKARPTSQRSAQAAGSSSALATADQRKEIVRLLDERGLGRPSEKLAFCNEVIAPAVIGSAKELTEFQAAQVLGALKAPVAA